MNDVRPSLVVIFLDFVTTTEGPLTLIPHDKHEVDLTQYFQTDTPTSSRSDSDVLKTLEVSPF